MAEARLLTDDELGALNDSIARDQNYAVLAERKRCAAIARAVYDDCGVLACVTIIEEIERG